MQDNKITSLEKILSSFDSVRFTLVMKRYKTNATFIQSIYLDSSTNLLNKLFVLTSQPSHTDFIPATRVVCYRLSPHLINPKTKRVDSSCNVNHFSSGDSRTFSHLFPPKLTIIKAKQIK